MEASALRAPAGLTRIALPGALLRLRSDEQLVALFRQGDDGAFRVIHDRYRARLFAYTRQMLGGSRSDAEDALQDVFLRAYNALRMDDRPVALKAWLYRVAHNRCVDHLRRPTPAPNEVFEMSRTPMPDPLAEAERRDDLRRLVADVRELPEQQRSALLMRELEGLSYAELAEALDVSVPAIKSLLVRARIGLVEAAEARDTACVEIREDLALSIGKGVRASALARRHMRECDGCRDYRARMRGVSRGMAALTPSSHLGLLAKLLGLGGASGGAAAGGSAAAGGGAAVVGGGVVTATTAKVAAIVCCAAVVGGGAAEIKQRTAPTAPSKAEKADRTPRVAAAAAVATPKTRPTPIHDTPAPRADRMNAAVAVRDARAARQRAAQLAAASAAAALANEEPISSSAAETAPAADKDEKDAVTGGALAPAETEDTATPATTGAGTQTGSAGTSDDEPTAVPASTDGTTAKPATDGAVVTEPSSQPGTQAPAGTSPTTQTAPTQRR